MFKGKLWGIPLIIIILIICVGVVSAEDNSTAVSADVDSNLQGNTGGLEINDVDEKAQDEINKSKISDYEYTVYIPKYMTNEWVQTIRVYEMPKDASGNISISIDGIEKYNQKVSVEANALILNDLNLDWGTHNATVKYTGDDKYSGFCETRQFEYSYLLFEIEENQSRTYPIEWEVIKGVSGTLKVFIDSKCVLSKKLSGNKDSDHIFLDDLSFGKHTYEVRYSGNYKSINKKGTFNIIYNFYIEDLKNEYQIKYGDKLEFTAVLPEDEKSKVNVKINNRTYSFKNYEEIIITSEMLDIGENTVIFTNKYSEFAEKPQETKITVIPDLTVPTTVDYEGNNKIYLSMPNSTKGTLNIEIDGVNYKTCELENGKAIIPLNNLTISKHNLTLKYDGDFKEYIPQANYTITVIPNLNIPSKIWIYGNYNLTFNASKDFNGNLILEGLIDATIPVENGSATLPLSNLNPGTKTLKAYYDNYTWTINVTVLNESPDLDMKIAYVSEVHVSDWEYNWEDRMTYELSIFNIPKNLPGVFTIYEDGEIVAILRNFEGPEVGTYAPQFSKIGKHTIKITYSGDEYFNPTNATHIYEVSNFLCNLYDDTLVVELPSDATGTLTVKVNGKKVDSEKVTKHDYVGPYSYYFTLKKIKDNDEIKVIYDGNYGKITKKILNKKDNDFEISYYDYDENYYGEDGTVSFYVPEDVKKRVTVIIDDKKYTYKGGYTQIDLSDLKPGPHRISISYPGDSKYPSKSFNATFNIKTKFSDLYTHYFEYKSLNTITLKLPKDAVGNMILEILNDETGEYEVVDNVSIADGYVGMVLPASKIGKYLYKLHFDGNYEVEKIEDYFIIYPTFKYASTMKYGDENKITVKLGDESQAILVISAWDIPIGEFNINSTNNIINLNKEMIDQVKSVIKVNAREGEYTLPVEGNCYLNGELLTDFYLGINIDVEFTPKLVGQDVVMQYNSEKTFTVKVSDIFGNVASKRTITIKIGKETFKVKTNEKGIATLKLTQTPGKYTIKTTFQGLTVKNTLTVKQILTLKKVTVKRSAKKLTLQATLSKVNGKFLKGKTITFKFSGKTYKAKTNAKGIAKVTIPKSVLSKLKSGKTITYQATYIKDTVKQSVKVQK